MTRLWIFLHLLGFTLWLGGGLGAMFAGIAARREDRSGIGAVARAQSLIHKTLVAPGALLTVVSGLILTIRFVGPGTAGMGFNPWLLVMQGAGIVAALLALLVALPTAAKLGRLDPSANPGYFDELRQRQRVVGMIWGLLGLVALVAGALLR